MATRRILVHLHARAAELAGARECAVELPEGADGRRLKAELARRHPALAGLLESCALATDRDLLGDAAAVADAGPLHLLPPVSGG
jgi:molybdopterin converting factor small subunit